MSVSWYLLEVQVALRGSELTIATRVPTPRVLRRILVLQTSVSRTSVQNGTMPDSQHWNSPWTFRYVCVEREIVTQKISIGVINYTNGFEAHR